MLEYNLNNEPCKVTGWATHTQSDDDGVTEHSTGGAGATADIVPPALKRFKFLASKMMSIASDASSSTQPAASSIQGQIENYLCEIQQPHDYHDSDALAFWSKRQASYSLLAELDAGFDCCSSFTGVRRTHLFAMWLVYYRSQE